MSLMVGTVVEMTRDAPYKEYDVCKGDIGVINYIAKTGKCSIHIYGKSNPHKDAWGENRLYGEQGDFWIPFDCVKEYTYKEGDRVKIVSNRSNYKGHIATIDKECCGYGHCSKYVRVYINDLDYKPLNLAKTSVRPIIANELEGELNMKLSGYNKVAAIEIAGKDYYYALYDEDIKAEDKVLVTGRLATDILTVKNVLTKDEARELCSVTITEEVRCKVDLSAYNQRVKNREEAEKLRKKMDDEIKKMDELNKYEMYADRNPALREMLEQLKGLGV